MTGQLGRCDLPPRSPPVPALFSHSQGASLFTPHWERLGPKGLLSPGVSGNLGDLASVSQLQAASDSRAELFCREGGVAGQTLTLCSGAPWWSIWECAEAWDGSTQGLQPTPAPLTFLLDGPRPSETLPPIKLCTSALSSRSEGGGDQSWGWGCTRDSSSWAAGRLEGPSRALEYSAGFPAVAEADRPGRASLEGRRWVQGSERRVGLG